MEMTIVPSSSTSTLPDHWIVEDRRRKSGKSAGVVDRYYYEPETGRMFRSLRSVENYLAGSNENRPLLYENENTPLSQMIGFNKRKPPNKTKKKSVALSTRSRASSFKLPDGWVVEEHQRKTGPAAGEVYKFYFEPETGRRFPSLRSVQTYLSESNEELPLSKMFESCKKRKLPHKTKKEHVELSTTSRASSFKLPDDWVVEIRRRRSGYTAGEEYKRYYEPETRVMFRLLKSVERYLKESDEKTPILKMLEFDNRGKLHHKAKMEIVARSTTPNTSSLKLPDGWIIEECFRASGASAGRMDRYYIEPGTGLKFRSLISVKRHLSELNLSHTLKSKPDNRLMLKEAQKQELQQKGNMADHDLSTSRTSSFEIPDDQTLKEFLSSYPNYNVVIGKCQQNFGSQKNVSGSKIKTLSFNSTNPPVRIRWVHTDPEGDTWSPFVGESMVPDSVKQQWTKAYMLITEVDGQHRMN